VHAKARADGRTATGAKWTLLAPLNATFSPRNSSKASPTFAYTVSKNPRGDSVKVTVRFTSTAGVGEKTWTQPIGPGQTINHLTGTFGGTFVSAGGTIHTWS